MNEFQRFPFGSVPVRSATIAPSRTGAADVLLPASATDARSELATLPSHLSRPARRTEAPRRRHLRLVVPPRAGNSEENGFSLLELLVVVAILGILVAAALPRFAEFRAAAYDSRSQQDLRNLAAAEELFRATSPTYASDAAQLSGFAPSEGVEIALESADETGFVATATHPAGQRDFRWDSSADPPLTSAAR